MGMQMQQYMQVGAKEQEVLRLQLLRCNPTFVSANDKSISNQMFSFLNQRDMANTYKLKGSNEQYLELLAY